MRPTVRLKWNCGPLFKPKTVVTDGNGNFGVVMGYGRLCRVHLFPWCKRMDSFKAHAYDFNLNEDESKLSEEELKLKEERRYVLEVASLFRSAAFWLDFGSTPYRVERYNKVVLALRAHTKKAIKFALPGDKYASTPVFHYLHPDNIVGLASKVVGARGAAHLNRCMCDAFHTSEQAYKNATMG